MIGSNRQKGVDYDRESGKVKFSGKEYIPDFMMAKINTCIEIKFLSDKSNKSKIIEQITADIPAYKGKYSRQLFIVYDLAGGIQNENEFTCDLEKQGNIKVIVIKH